MLRWVLRSLALEPGRVLGSAAGVGLALALVVFFQAVFAGEAERIVAYPRHAGADVWVMQEGVSQMHMASSMLLDSKAIRVRRVAGVAGVTPILYMNAMLRAGGRDWFSYLVGLPPGAPRGGPWAMAAGRSAPRPGEVVIPAVVARLAGLAIGDTVRVTDRTLKVVGLSRGTFSMANSVTFLAWEDLEAIMDVFGALSYLLVVAAPGEDRASLARRIEASVDKVNALPSAVFVARDREMAMQMGTEIIRLMTVIGAVMATLIVAFTAYSQVVRAEREYAVAKALGFGGRHLAAAAVAHSLVVTAAGLLVCGLVAVLLPGVSRLVPQVSLLVTAPQLLRVAAIALPVAVLASLVPAIRLARIEPMVVFRS